MSEGPIKRWRDSWKPPIVTTSAKDRVCFIDPSRGLHPYCGRRKRARVTFDRAEATCSECLSMWRADHEPPEQEQGR